MQRFNHFAYRRGFALLPVLVFVVAGCGGQGRSAGAGPPGRVEPGAAFTAGGPEQLVFDSAGSLYGADCQDSWVFRIDAKAAMSIVAGTGSQGFSGDGGPAVRAQFTCPAGVAVDAKGNLYVTDHGDNRVRIVDRRGMVHAFAGAGPIPPIGSNEGAFGGDGGQARRALFRAPVNLAIASHANIYLSDRDNGAVREIRPDGVVTTVAGTGERGFSGDGGPAKAAKLDQPQGITFDDAGNMYIADSANNRVRRVDPMGVITTFAGDGHHGYSGDGGPARSAKLSDPAALAFDTHGNLYVAEPDEGVVRKIDREGIITTVAGTGRLGFSGDGGSATKAMLNQPYALAFDTNGNLYIGDHDNGRIRKVDTKGVITTYFNGRS
jgi:streptogramin lyase